MTTVVQTSYPEPTGYQPPLQQQQGYPASGYPQTGYPAQPATVIQVPPPQATTTTTTVGPRYNKKAGLVTGTLQIIAGGLSISIGVVLWGIGSWFALSFNIWGGIAFYVVTGILGVVSKNQKKCVIVAYLVMCIISAVCAGSQIIYDCIAAGNTRHVNLDYCARDYYYDGEKCARQKAIMAMHSFSALTAFGEMVIAIVGSAYCCSGLCSGATPAQTMKVTYAQTAPAGVTVVAPGPYPASSLPAAPGIYPQGQPAMNVQGQPPAYAQQQPQAPFPEQPMTQEEPK